MVAGRQELNPRPSGYESDNKTVWALRAGGTEGLAGVAEWTDVGSGEDGLVVWAYESESKRVDPVTNEAASGVVTLLLVARGGRDLVGRWRGLSRAAVPGRPPRRC